MNSWEQLQKQIQAKDFAAATEWLSTNTALIQQQVVSERAKRILGDRPVAVVPSNSPPILTDGIIRVGEFWECSDHTWDLFRKRITWGNVLVMPHYIKSLDVVFRGEGRGCHYTCTPIFLASGDPDSCYVEGEVIFYVGGRIDHVDRISGSRPLRHKEPLNNVQDILQTEMGPMPSRLVKIMVESVQGMLVSECTQNILK